MCGVLCVVFYVATPFTAIPLCCVLGVLFEQWVSERLCVCARVCLHTYQYLPRYLCLISIYYQLSLQNGTLVLNVNNHLFFFLLFLSISPGISVSPPSALAVNWQLWNGCPLWGTDRRRKTKRRTSTAGPCVRPPTAWRPTTSVHLLCPAPSCFPHLASLLIASSWFLFFLSRNKQNSCSNLSPIVDTSILTTNFVRLDLCTVEVMTYKN